MYNINTSIIMKSFLNYSKLAITTLIASSVFVACSDEISETTCDAQYVANVGNLKNAGEAVDLGLPSGTKWANINIGASSATDNGVLFVWGDITGTQSQAPTPTSYTDVAAPVSVSDLFNMYKSAEQKTGAICDTTNVTSLTGPMLLKLTAIGDTIGMDSLAKAQIDAQKMNEIKAYVKNQLNTIKQSKTGFLEAALSNEDFAIIIDWNGTDFVERFPAQKTERDTLDYFKKFDNASNSIFNIDVIGTTEVKFYDSPSANSYTEIKDQFNVVMRKDYNGGDITKVPAYNIIADAKDDAAAANWGGNWRMPTTAQFQELIDECEWEFTGNGYKVSSKKEGNTNFIFLPAAGYRFGDKWYGNGNAGYYATGEIFGTYHFPSMVDQVNGSEGTVTSTENMPNMLIFQHGQFVNEVNIYSNLTTSYGVSIRPVTK